MASAKAQLQWIYWLLNLVMLLAILGSAEVISTNSLGRCTPKSILNKKNRDGKTPKFPLKEDLRVKSSYIYKAHEILAQGLKEFFNLEETDLGTYFSHIISKNNGQLYLDEYGRTIDSYQDVFISIWEQYNETLCENYAIKQLDTDSLDLCSAARFLSHQPTVKERTKIVKKMRNALKYECGLCTPYKKEVPCYPVNKFSGIKSTVLWESICGRKPSLVRIRSVNKREFIYAASDDYLSDERRRRAVFTWGDLKDIPGVAGNGWTGEETWLIEPLTSSAVSNNSYLFLLKNAKPNIPPRGYLYVNSSDNHSVYVSNIFPNDENAAKLSLGASAVWQLLVKSSDNGRTTDFCLPENKNVELCNPGTFILRNDNYTTDVYLNAEEDDISINDPSRLRRNTRLLPESSPWEILPALPSVNKVLWDSICEGAGPVLVRIRNVNTTELLFASLFNGNERGLRVFTWRNLTDKPCEEGNEWTHEETWWIEPVPQRSASGSNATSSVLLKNGKLSSPPRRYLYVDSSDRYGLYVRDGFLDDDSAKSSLDASARWQLLVKSSDNGRITDFCLPENKNMPISQFILRNEMPESEYLGANRADYFALRLETSDNTLRRYVYVTSDIVFWEIILVI